MTGFMVGKHDEAFRGEGFGLGFRQKQFDCDASAYSYMRQELKVPRCCGLAYSMSFEWDFGFSWKNVSTTEAPARATSMVKRKHNSDHETLWTSTTATDDFKRT